MVGRREILVKIQILPAAFIFALILLVGPGGRAAGAAQGCLKCHEGIEKIADTLVMSGLTCVQCHRGDDRTDTMEDAHRGMYANPSDYRVVEKTCGGCHPEEVRNSKKSLHATMAGMISGTRYAWGAQDTKDALYATYDVADEDGSVPEQRGAVESLGQLPVYDPEKPMDNGNSPADDYLRNQCLRCHLWSSGHEREGDYRGSGCAACHMVYTDKGTYEGGDRAVPKDRKDRPRLHKLTNVIPVFQCLHCHNRGGRTGVSYIGAMESDGYGSPWSAVAGEKGGVKLHGKHYNRLTADVHYLRGMLCIDCHTKQDLHGDGNIYSKREQAVEIECVDCHGAADEQSGLKSSWGNPLGNLKIKDGKVVLASRDGRERVVPQTMDVVGKSDGLAAAAMGIARHMSGLECYACHARWAPQCYGCHAQQNLAKKSGDWINVRAPEDISKSGTKANRGKTAYEWRETRSYLRWETPVLGINAEGLVSPFIPGCQVIFTQTGPGGKAVYHNKVFTTYNGHSGVSHNPVFPHTVSREARACEDCHSSRKAVGLGGGVYDTRANGVDVPFELERIVDEKGRQLQATGHFGARPFNMEEQNRVLRVSVCISCHDAQKNAAVWKRVTDVTGFAKTDEKHRDILRRIFEKGAIK
jgi:hypothetical protein